MYQNLQKNVKKLLVFLVLIGRDVPECVFEFRPEPDRNRNSISSSGRNRTGTLIVLILHLRNMFFALYRLLYMRFLRNKLAKLAY